MNNNKNVIDSDSIKQHLIQKYNFKILSSQTAHNDEISDETKSKEDLGNELKEQEDKKIKDGFISELLEKSDKMSSDIVKLQMKIEDGQKEFEERLKKQTQSALKEGEQKGYNLAKKELEDEYLNLKVQYRNSIRKLDDTFGECKTYMDTLKDELSHASVEIAKEVVVQEISKNSSEIALALAKSLINDIKNANKISIKTNPKDYEFIKENFSQFKNIEIFKDDAISEGGVILLSDLGNIDGNINTRIDRAKQLLSEKL